MTTLLPLFCVILVARLLGAGKPGAETCFGRREALLAAAVGVGLFATAVAELSSLARLFDPPVIIGAWLLLTVVLAASVWKKRGSTMPREASSLPRPSSQEVALLSGLALLLVAVALTAGAAAPNAWDSMTYHLPRITHWIQNASVSHYPTHVLRQLTLGPGAELLAAQIELLSGSDRGINFLQTFAWLGAAIAASLLAKDLGASRLGQGVAAVFAATLPMAILQASSTQNDLVVSFWLLVFAHFALRAWAGEMDLSGWLLAGGSLGLAVLTKATALTVAFPFGLVLAAAAVRGRARGLRGLAAAALLALAVNAGYMTRNLSLFGSPLGGEHGTVNAAFSPGLVLSNVARNLSLQLLTPFPSWNARVEAAVVALHRAIGLSANDPRSTWRGAQFHVPARLEGAQLADADESVYAAFLDNAAGNPLHLLLGATCVGVLAVRRSFPESRRLWGFLALVAAGFLLFSLVLKWQPWGARLELPFLLLAAPLAGVVLGKWRGGIAVAALLLLCAAPWALVNATHPLLGPDSVLTSPRILQSFAASPGLREPLLEAARAVATKRCRRIGLEMGPDDPEHLIRVSLRDAGISDAQARVEHVHVTNRSAPKALEPLFAGFAPCAVITMAPRGAPPAASEFYAAEWGAGRLAVRSVP
ncbi:MAG TPA: glycosyltransferase family 39 protein [Thermoanaerobaculia bacterium]|nr:glycosyltransferase family 39 protein [Thermoanaerobaculia bacterium]